MRLQDLAALLKRQQVVEQAAAGPQLLIREIKQATPVSIRAVLHFDVLLGSDSVYVRWISAMWWLLMFGVVRFVHLQRSTFAHMDEDGGFFFCHMGKRSVRRQRFPFRWCVPRRSLTNKDPVEVLNQCVRDASGGRSCPWLLCDFGPPRVPSSKLSSAVCSPMSISRFASLRRQLLQMPPGQLSAEQAAGISTYSGRRLSPTLADLGQFPDTKRLKLGGWLNEELIAQQQQMAQPNRYADQKILAQLDVKMEVQEMVRSAARKLGKASLSMDWADMRKAFIGEQERIAAVAARKQRPMGQPAVPCELSCGKGVAMPTLGPGVAVADKAMSRSDESESTSSSGESMD
ncbi:unnamed protein product [Polarella glacialis]|uniref:Uncharacterized protein n=1 Tax=Polarella glacialis TaxID=89957 RepID=A0A813JH04_POLGL|nr:unnamed protein product [Polarella glacialis]